MKRDPTACMAFWSTVLCPTSTQQDRPETGPKKKPGYANVYMRFVSVLVVIVKRLLCVKRKINQNGRG